MSSTDQRLAAAHAYRPDIDGLRAVSILAVLGYHAAPEVITGGYVGVDIFFVISGFLITRIILGEIDAQTFSLRNFYRRRIRRIFPALIVTLSATWLAGWFLLLPDAFARLGAATLAGTAFVANLYQLSQISYFAPDAADNPLLHLWSLGIEEQFYIAWPLLLMWLGARGNRRWWIRALALLSFATSLVIFLDLRDWTFYSPIPRAWELLAGAVLAHRAHVAGDAFSAPSARAELFSRAGIVMVGVSIFAFNHATPFPGPTALLPVLGAALLIASPGARVNQLLLANRPMVAIGLISYPLYLWHWPLLSFLHIIRNGEPTALELAGAVVAAFVLAWATYTFVEQPIRHGRVRALQLATTLAAVGIAGFVTMLGNGFVTRFPAEIREIAALPSHDNSGFRPPCFRQQDDGKPLDPSCIEGGDAPLVFVWGDSTAAALYPGLEALQKDHAVRLGRATFAGCPPILGIAHDVPAFCATANARIMTEIAALRPQAVLLHAMWGSTNDIDRLRATVAQLRAAGVQRIVLVGPVPVWKRGLPDTLVNVYRFRHTLPERLAEGVSGEEVDAVMAAFAAQDNIIYASPWRALCDSDGCLTRIGPAARDVIIWDKVHLTNAGATFVTRALANELFGADRRP